MSKSEYILNQSFSLFPFLLAEMKEKKFMEEN